MSQICSFCGCPLEEGCGVCPNCGSPVSGGDALDTPLYNDPTLESVSGEEFSAAPAPEPVSEPTAVPKAEPMRAPKAVSVPKASDYDHIIPTPPKTSAASTASTASSASTPKPKKKRSCCGCCLPVLIAMALSVFLIFSGIAGEIFAELDIPVDLTELEALLSELMGELPMELPAAEQRPAGDIPANAVEFNGHCYYLYTEPVDSFEAAQAFCQERGGYLASVTSDEESRFLYDYILSLGLTEYAYLGGSDAGEEGVWVWSSGEPFAYTNWNDGEPNDDLDGEDEMAMHRLFDGGMWNDIAFTTPSVMELYPEIAQIEASSVLNGKAKYSADTLIDGDLYTAWNEGADGIAGESVTHYFTGEYTLTGLEIWGGFQYSEEIYYANARPATVELAFSDGTVLVCALEDVRDVQHIAFDQPVTAEWVTLTVTESYAGSSYADLCISELYYQAGAVPVCGFLCEWGEVTPAE